MVSQEENKGNALWAYRQGSSTSQSKSLFEKTENADALELLYLYGTTGLNVGYDPVTVP